MVEKGNLLCPTPLSLFLYCSLSPLSLTSLSQYRLDQMMPLPLWLIFPTVSGSLSTAHPFPGLPMRPTDWQQHKSQGCIKNTLDQRKELGLHLSGGEYLLSCVLNAASLVYHHLLFWQCCELWTHQMHSQALPGNSRDFGYYEYVEFTKSLRTVFISGGGRSRNRGTGPAGTPGPNIGGFLDGMLNTQTWQNIH